MATLADVTSEVRIGIKLAAVCFAVLIGLFLFFKGGVIVKNLFFPAPPAPPEEKFGKLEALAFPAQKQQNLTYTVNTLTGTLQNFGDRIKVYKTIKPEPSLVALDTARSDLIQSGFVSNETKISDSIYQWSNDSGASIQYNILNNNFVINSNFLSDPPPVALIGDVANKDGAFNSATSFLQSINEPIDDLDEANSTITYLKLVNNQLVTADSQNEAQFIRIDLFQKNINKDYKIYYPSLTSSTMYFVFKSDNNLAKIVDASFMHIVPDLKTSSTYPIKTTQQAYDDLKKGNALIFNTGNSSQIDITDVTVGYYLGDENQQYLLPIIVFTGKDFTAYVNALAD